MDIRLLFSAILMCGTFVAGAAQATPEDDYIILQKYGALYEAAKQCAQKIDKDGRRDWNNPRVAKLAEKCFAEKGLDDEYMYRIESAYYNNQSSVRQMGQRGVPTTQIPVAVPDKAALMRKLQGVRDTEDVTQTGDEESAAASAEDVETRPSSRSRVYIPSTRSNTEASGAKPVFLGR